MTGRPELTAGDFSEINTEASKIEIQGERLARIRTGHDRTLTEGL